MTSGVAPGAARFTSSTTSWSRSTPTPRPRSGAQRPCESKVLVALEKLGGRGARTSGPRPTWLGRPSRRSAPRCGQALTRPKRGSYEKALAACKPLPREAHGSDAGAKTGVALQAWVQKETEKAVSGAIKRSRALVLARVLGRGPRAVLQPVWPPLGPAQPRRRGFARPRARSRLPSARPRPPSCPAGSPGNRSGRQAGSGRGRAYDRRAALRRGRAHAAGESSRGSSYRTCGA